MRRLLSALAAFALVTTGVALGRADSAQAGAQPSQGCADLNNPALDGFNTGRSSGSTRAFQKNDTVTITVDSPADNHLSTVFQVTHLALNTVVDANDTSATLPHTYTYTFDHSDGFVVRWAALNNSNAAVNATWTVSCTPTTSTFSAACEDAREEPVHTYAGAGYPGSSIPFQEGERLVVTSSSVNGSPVPDKTIMTHEGSSTPVAETPGFGTIGYTIPVGDVGKLISWQILGGTNASWKIYCYPAAQSNEFAANVVGHGIVKLNGTTVVDQDFANTYVGPNDSVPNAIALDEQFTRNGLLSFGYEGPITCTTDTTPSGTQPDAFRNVGDQLRTLQPTSDNYINILISKYDVTCTQTAIAPCGENAPTPAGYTLVKGTAGNDNLIGGSGKQIIKGLGGNDRISDLSGDDIICGGAGDDTLSGGGGNDVVLGGAGNDSLDGGSGTDSGYDPDAGTRYTSIEKVL